MNDSMISPNTDPTLTSNFSGHATYSTNPYFPSIVAYLVGSRFHNNAPEKTDIPVIEVPGLMRDLQLASNGETTFLDDVYRVVFQA